MAAWVVAIIAIAIVEEGQFSWAGALLPPIFSPAGFPFLLLLTYGAPNGSLGLYSGAFVGWSYYAALTMWTLQAKRRVAFAWLFTILSISLLLNIAGCEARKHANIKIGCEYRPASERAGIAEPHRTAARN